MSEYKAPVRDIEFSMFELFDYEAHYERYAADAGVDRETVRGILAEFAKFCENELAPINRSGDEQGCAWRESGVTTPEGFKRAFESFAQAGWLSLPWDPAHGGQGLPISLAKALFEMLATANTGFSLYTSALPGAIETLSAYGTPAQRAMFENKLISGEWNATMCLTEPHCGTDLGMLRTKATPDAEGAHTISGTKIFITGGDHDLTENIIHLVLARLPDAQAGTGGISLFIVPKFLCNDDGELLARNAVNCGSIEKKMGVKASATCTMNFEGATGYLLGEPHRGLKAMFTFINASRIAAACQGVAHAELGLQKSLSYARERLQMRALTGTENPDGPADPIIVHPDVRRMLLTQKAFAEGHRMMIHYMAKQLDLAHLSTSEVERAAAVQRLDFMTPIAKAFATETGVECANHAIQCFGGHGYIREWGVEQNARDARIATLYEGTTGIQGLDLVHRKIIGSRRKLLDAFADEVARFLHDSQEKEAPFSGPLTALMRQWSDLTDHVIARAKDDPNEIGAASVPYAMYAGYVCLAYFWSRAARQAMKKISEGDDATGFYRSKLSTAKFYFNHLLPRTLSLKATIEAGSCDLMGLDENHFSFAGA